MKVCALLALAMASSLGAQTPSPRGKALPSGVSGTSAAPRRTTSDQRIPIQKTHVVPIDTVVLRRVDTVTLWRVDTVYVPVAAAGPLAAFDTLMKTDTLKCTNKVFPVPIPIPLPGPDRPGGPSVASTAPEPATAWLVGAGLIALGFVWGRRARGTRSPGSADGD